MVMRRCSVLPARSGTQTSRKCSGQENHSRLSGLVHLKGRSLTAILIKGRDTAVIHAGAGILQSQPDLPVLLGMRRAGGRFGVDAGDRNRHSLILVIDKRHSHGQCAIGAGLDDVGILPGGSYQKPGAVHFCIDAADGQKRIHVDPVGGRQGVSVG